MRPPRAKQKHHESKTNLIGKPSPRPSIPLQGKKKHAAFVLASLLGVVSGVLIVAIHTSATITSIALENTAVDALHPSTQALLQRQKEQQNQQAGNSSPATTTNWEAEENKYAAMRAEAMKRLRRERQRKNAAALNALNSSSSSSLGKINTVRGRKQRPQLMKRADAAFQEALKQGVSPTDLILNSDQTTLNSQRVVDKRTQFSKLCNQTNSTTETLTDYLHNFFQPGEPDDNGSNAPLDHIVDRFISPCPYTFLDFGANVGDSALKLIDSNLPSCPDKGIKTSRLALHEDSNKTQIRVEPFNKRLKIFNNLIKWVGEELDTFARDRYNPLRVRIHPEQMCYFGIEGNPVFTKRLQQLQQQIMRSSPRPLRFAHFFTETVGSANDGPATLYLDTLNKDKNYWGSSVNYSHPDVQRSIQKDGHVTNVTVNGVSLLTLIEKTVLKERGSLALIKMDIEGSEKDVLEAASRSPLLQEYTKKGVQIHIIVERHGPPEEYENLVQAFHKLGVKLDDKVDAG